MKRKLSGDLRRKACLLGRWLIGALLWGVLGLPGRVWADPAWDRSLARLERKLAESAAVGRALARVQNDWGGRVLLVAPRPDCSDRIAGDRAARTRVFGADWHRRLGLLRDELERLRARSPGEDLLPLETALQEQEEAYWAAFAWQQRLVEPWARRCELQILPGPGPAEPGGGLRETGPVAIIALSGLICPATVAGAGGVLVVEGPVCADALDGCDCVPHEVLPGGALGGEP